MSTRDSRRFTALRTTLVALVAGTLLSACERPPTDTVQTGYRGTGMVQVYNPRTVAAEASKHVAPMSPPAAPPVGPKAKDVYQNVQVLGDLSVGQFVALMASITQWVAPDQGCTYCHAGANLAADDLYTKIVARRMLKMTREINSDWTPHVADTGVTCYTCHRGKPVPEVLWFKDDGPPQKGGLAMSRAGQNLPSEVAAFSSMHYDPFSAYLSANPERIDVIDDRALPEKGPLYSSTQATEKTYALMMHMSESLGVNCTYCHNTRAMAEWGQSSPKRVTAWHGIRMVQWMNEGHLEPLGPQYPAARLGPAGDAPKVNCGTCHQGAYKPLLGAKMAASHPGLAKPEASK